MARAELEAVGRHVHCARGRFYFDAVGTDGRHVVQALSEVRHVRSIRRIAVSVEVRPPDRSNPADLPTFSAGQLAEAMDSFGHWDDVEGDLRALNISVRSCCVVSRQFQQLARLLTADVAHELHRELALCLQRRFGWHPCGRGRSADLTLHLHVEGSTLRVEVPLLQQQKAKLGGGFPHQGMHHVEAWAIARSLDVQPGETVLDPMCGKGTILAEAAVWWPRAIYVGCDADALQLEHCRRNFEWLEQSVVLHQANTTQPGGTPLLDASVDKVVVAPPWDRQFGISGSLVAFYQQMLQEIFRVVRPGGRVVVFASRRVLPKLLEALDRSYASQGAVKAGASWRITAQRSFALTRATTGVILVLRFTPECSEASRFLSWEGRGAPEGGRELYEHWRQLRAQGFPRLEVALPGLAKVDSSAKTAPALRLLVALIFCAGVVLGLRSRV
ncbi:Thumpd2 [Symbiodinium necroappetens]|uniref:Thumpd2 protein n=1 Tax=Symbiodinium necroappetens TaxID=1628268 RepID=A0A812QTQ8_9DINO|nr:Thumpd2 [Symbiodinium necroappetens]